ncbi:MAG: AAA family ATPase, partial [Propionibacteriaceae bacterium]|nr:AAA family ATPase [Propionibacteriaceae bacterium]
MEVEGFVPRRATTLVEEALADTRVVLVMGARQTGKSTLLDEVARRRWGKAVLTLDDAATRAAAANDPTGFVADLETPVAIDEAQRAPDLLLAIKQRVDQDQRPGQFLLSGSSNLMSNRRIKDALTGRIEIIDLRPLSLAELHATKTSLVDRLFAQDIPQVTDAP